MNNINLDAKRAVSVFDRQETRHTTISINTEHHTTYASHLELWNTVCQDICISLYWGVSVKIKKRRHNLTHLKVLHLLWTQKQHFSSLTLLSKFPSASWYRRQPLFQYLSGPGNGKRWILEQIFFWTTQIFLKVNTGGPHLYLSLKFAANILTLCSLARSSSMTSHFTLALSSLILSMAACVLLRSRQANTTVQPCSARERAVSNPMQK